jgi:small subunit ribosomal protein S8
MDVVADLITKIRNASGARHEKVDIPSSNLRVALVDVLKKEGYVKNYKVVRDGKQGMMRVYLKYDEKGQAAFAQIERVSRPGRRYFVNSEKIPKVQSGFGIAILSTSKGVLSGGDAKSQNVGGEYLVRVW